MPVSATILEQHNLVYVHYSGLVTKDQLEQSMHNTYSQPSYRPGMSEIGDLREIQQIDIQFDAMMQYVGQVTKQHRRHGAAPKLALIEICDIQFGMARMFQSLIEASGLDMDIAIVKTQKAALAFLGLPDVDLGICLDLVRQ